ncbi:hypothetical protein BH11VER1_BH11VER1_39320 [soil metagenome]
MNASETQWLIPSRKDPRWIFAGLLALYAVMGCTVLGFNRDPWQVALTVLACCGLDAWFARWFRGEKLVPLSACITGLGLSLLVNYPHDYVLLLLPAFIAIASKYVLTVDGKHVFNPGLMGLLGALTLGAGRFSSAPAYQWGGSVILSLLLSLAALSLFIYKLRLQPLIASFLISFGLLTLLRAWIMRWHLPPETIILGTLTSPAFFLFTFYMLTDPKTSPSGAMAQVAWGALVAVLDLAFHLKSSLATLFWALFVASSGRWVWLQIQSIKREGWSSRLPSGRWVGQLVALSLIAIMGAQVYARLLYPEVLAPRPGFQFEKVSATASGVSSGPDDLLSRVDPRAAHIAKWVMSVGDAVAVGDFDNDGLPDIFLTNPHKRPEDRNALYRNLGSYRFERVPLPALAEIGAHPEQHGIVSGAVFVDYDNSGRQSLMLVTGWGKVRLLRNELRTDGGIEFRDVTREAGIDEYTVSVAVTFADFDLDGNLDLFIGNAMAPELPGYDRPVPFNIFKLPQPEFAGDRRMFHFMHSTWHNATNGGRNVLYHNDGHGHFKKQDIAALGMPETHWTMAVGTADLNHDGWPDIYCASDYGPDDLYLNHAGRSFERVASPIVGHVGHDTYKGMNVSIGDLDNRGYQDIYVSNVHAPLQAEGSLLWRTEPNSSDPFHPSFNDAASERRLLNEQRFGWGAAMGDLNLDGWLDLVQVNGMVDDTPDKRFDTPHDYWYQAAQIMRAGPEIHSYADCWPDLRGYEIWGHQKNRVCLSSGHAPAKFVDVANEIGITEATNTRAAALIDLDNAGALDLIFTHQFAGAEIFRNNLMNNQSPDKRPHWIGLQLRGDGRKVNRDAVGTQVFVITKNGRQMREVSLTSGFSAQGDRRLHYGLGLDAESVDIEIRWPGAGIQKINALPVDRYHIIQFDAPVQVASDFAAPP